jgi:hypothetical protein
VYGSFVKLNADCVLHLKCIEVSEVTVHVISYCCYAERDMKYSRWKMAIERSLGWVDDEINTEMYGEGMDINNLSL